MYWSYRILEWPLWANYKCLTSQNKITEIFISCDEHKKPLPKEIRWQISIFVARGVRACFEDTQLQDGPCIVEQTFKFSQLFR